MKTILNYLLFLLFIWVIITIDGAGIGQLFVESLLIIVLIGLRVNHQVLTDFIMRDEN